MIAGKKWGGDWKTLKNCTVYYAGQRWTMAAIYMGPNTTFAGRLKKLNSIQREGIRIYTGAFRSS